MSLRSKLIGLIGSCGVIACAAGAMPGAASAQCLPPGCKPPPQPHILSITGTEAAQTLSTYYGGTSQLIVNGWYPNPPSPPPPVTFKASLSNSFAPVLVVAHDELWCVDSSYNYYAYTFPHDSAVGAGTASVTFQPTLSCPTGQKVAESAQVGQAQLPGGTYPESTPTVTFAWEGLGYCSDCT
ncbi:MAG: hypothetical protein JO027_11445 [Solirubrobacterales bacterium]|nr:hypothetical protein [Solirubrobacterales bacterium]